MASASGSNPAPGDESKKGTKKGDKAKDNCKASADSEIEKKRKLEEELRESKGEVERKNERIKILEAELEARNAEVKKLKRGKESNIREATIKEKILRGRELDVAFLVHVDANVEDKSGKRMKECINFIEKIVDRMASENKKQEWKLRIAFAPYRDYKYHTSVKFDAEPCDFTHRFTKPNNLLKRALSRFGANNSDRNETPEYFGGNSKFEEYLAIFDWKATNRVIIHITDDHYPPKYSMRKHDVKTAIGGSLEIVEKKFQELYLMSRAEVLKPLIKPLLQPITKYLPKEIEHRPPIGKSGRPKQIQCRSYFEHKWYTELEDLITTIKEHKDLLYMKGREKVQVQIAEKPFKDDHQAMWPYFAKVTVQGEAPKEAVAYRFKTPVENNHSPASSIEDWHKEAHYLARMEVHSVAVQMATAFNEIIEESGIGMMKLQFSKVTTLSIGSGENKKFYNVVEDPKGSPNTTDRHDDILQAFTHWTHHRSDTLLMVQIHPQGVELRKSLHTQDVYLHLSDPVIHCSDLMRFITHKHIDTHTNLGSEGFRLFSTSHNCNNVCKQLRLAPLL